MAGRDAYARRDDLRSDSNITGFYDTRQPIDLSDHRPPIHRRLLDLAVATAAEPRAAARQLLPHQRLGDVGALEAADRDAAIVGPIAVTRTANRLLPEFSIEVVEVTDAQARPCDLGAFVPGQPDAGALAFSHVLTRSARLPEDAAGSRAFAETASDAAASFDVRKNGASVGTLEFDASDTATFTVASAVDFVAGDRLQLVAPNPQDATLVTFALELT